MGGPPLWGGVKLQPWDTPQHKTPAGAPWIPFPPWALGPGCQERWPASQEPLESAAACTALCGDQTPRWETWKPSACYSEISNSQGPLQNFLNQEIGTVWSWGCFTSFRFKWSELRFWSLRFQPTGRGRNLWNHWPLYAQKNINVPYLGLESWGFRRLHKLGITLLYIFLQ